MSMTSTLYFVSNLSIRELDQLLRETYRGRFQ